MIWWKNVLEKTHRSQSEKEKFPPATHSIKPFRPVVILVRHFCLDLWIQHELIYIYMICRYYYMLYYYLIIYFQISDVINSTMSLCMFHIITDLALKFEVQLDGRKNINRLARDVNVDAKRRRHMISHDVYSFWAGNAQPRALSASRPLRVICWLDDACCICRIFLWFYI